MASVNYGVCRTCRRRVPVAHAIRNGKVYVAKDCPQCGPSEMLVSSDAATWQHKREVWGYDPDEPLHCSLHCETCAREHHPRMVFLDVTNRCNMNCPICIANIPGMGFEFNPPLEYFERVCAGLAAMDPPPTVQLFGGEPTVRDDLFEIIAMARAQDLPISLVTNSMRLADEEFCRQVCERRIDMLLAFDGRGEEIYRRMRGSAASYYKKLQALETGISHIPAATATAGHSIVIVCSSRALSRATLLRLSLPRRTSCA